MRWKNKNTCRWPVLLVISVPKIFLNGQFYFNLSSKTWSHVFLEHSVDWRMVVVVGAKCPTPCKKGNCPGGEKCPGEHVQGNVQIPCQFSKEFAAGFCPTAAKKEGYDLGDFVRGGDWPLKLSPVFSRALRLTIEIAFLRSVTLVSCVPKADFYP